MRELVRGQFRIRGTMAGAKVDVGAVGKGSGADVAVHFDSVAAGVDPYTTEVRAKSGLHVGAHGVRQRTSFALTDPGFEIGPGLDAAGDPRWWRGRDGDPCARHTHHRVRRAVRLPLQRIIAIADFEFRWNGIRQTRRRKSGKALNAHNSVSDAICLMLERVVGLSANEFPLNDRCAVLCGRCGHARRRRGSPAGRGAQNERICARSASACAQPAVPIATGIGRPGRRAVATSRGVRVFMVRAFWRAAPAWIARHAASRTYQKLVSGIPQIDSRTGVNSSDFLASPEARRELPAATRTTGGPNGDRGVDLAIFPGIWDALLLSVAILVLAPGRFSTMNGWPSRSDSH